MEMLMNSIMKLHVSGPVTIPGDPYGNIATFVVVKDGKRVTCVVDADELKVVGTRFKTIRSLLLAIKGK
jgi:hypothetical protein